MELTQAITRATSESLTYGYWGPNDWVPSNAAAGAHQGSGVAWMVHLTDMHTTQFEQQQLKIFGAREADFRHFAQAVLKPMAPGALMITGDLVDAKTKLKRGLQNETEWQVRTL